MSHVGIMRDLMQPRPGKELEYDKRVLDIVTSMEPLAPSGYEDLTCDEKMEPVGSDSSCRDILADDQQAEGDVAPPKESDIEVVSEDGGDPDSFDETLLNFETGSHECILCSGLAQVR